VGGLALRHVRQIGKVSALLLASVLLLAATPQPTQAGWFTKILREAGDAADGAGKRAHLPDGFGALGEAALHIKGVAAIGKGVPLATHVTQEGHWKFANRSGEVFTAANATEMQRVTQALAPNASADTKLSLYLSDETVFEGRALLKDLPPEADLYFVDGKTSYPLTRRTQSGTEALFATLRPNIAVEISDRRMFSEAVFQLNRPLNKSNIRILALEPGGPQRLSSVPGFDPATKTALVDAIDPLHIDGAFSAVRGQSVVVTGRVYGALLHAVDCEIPMEKLTRAAEANDVNLVVLQSSATRQPGGRNWLWQKVEVSGLDDAMKRATFADFLNALGATRGELAVTAAPAGQGRITLKALPTGDGAGQVTSQLSDWWGDAVSSVTGEVVTKALEVHARDERAQTEQDARIVSWLPSAVHVIYLAAFVSGLICIPVTRGWWQRVWPRENRAGYNGALGYWAARAARGLAYVFLFMPLTSVPALPVLIWRVVWGYLTLPGRIFRWLSGRSQTKPT
jgi:hypothetical protein